MGLSRRRGYIMLMVLMGGLFLYLGRDRVEPDAGIPEGFFLHKAEMVRSGKPVADSSGAGIGPALAAPERGDAIASFMEKHKGREILEFFAGMTRRFGQVNDLAGHLEAVRPWLWKMYSPEEAALLMSLYARYLESEIALAEHFALREFPDDREGRLAFLDDVYDFRVRYMGEEQARWLFAEDVSENRYRMERREIIGNIAMSAGEKLLALESLNAAYFEENELPPPVSSNPYQSYRELLEIHSLDLDRMASDAERHERIRILRRQSLPEDAVARLEAMEEQMVREKRNERVYRGEREKILSDSSLDAQAKEEEIRRLQDRYLGDTAAEAMRRRERMAEALQAKMTGGN